MILIDTRLATDIGYIWSRSHAATSLEGDDLYMGEQIQNVGFFQVPSGNLT